MERQPGRYPRREHRFLSRSFRAFALVCSLPLSGCSSVGLGYLLQAGKGQLALSNTGRPLQEVLKDERVNPRLRGLLGRIPEVKAWGEAQGLKPTRNYEEFVQLDRPAVVWVVSASHPLRFEAKKWSFPLVGSFTYLGWFDREAALRYAQEVRATEQLDVDVRGASAYSTLGWFKDPVLSTMIPSGEEALGELVELVLHESVHATTYVNDQSTFNESLASFVAERLAPVYLAREPAALEAYLKSRDEGRRRQEEFHRAYEELDRLYSDKGLAEDLKRESKGQILGELRKRLGLSREINNATLIQFRTYSSDDSLFEAHFESCGKDWRRFLSSLSKLRPEDFPGAQSSKLEGPLRGPCRS